MKGNSALNWIVSVLAPEAIPTKAKCTAFYTSAGVAVTEIPLSVIKAAWGMVLPEII
jgi:hypothetical protein